MDPEDPPVVSPGGQLEEQQAEDAAKCRELVRTFLLNHTAGDMIPESSKVVVFDTDLPVKFAFYALLEHEINSAPLWDSKAKEFVGMLTSTDFIAILQFFHRQGDLRVVAKDFENHKIRAWREIVSNKRPSDTLISLDPERSLLDACKRLHTYNIHRLPCIQKFRRDTVLHIITHSEVLKYLSQHMFDEVPFLFNYMHHTIEELGIGTFGSKVVTVSRDTPLVQIFDILLDRHISAVPVVDDYGVVHDVYSRTDIVALAKERNYNLNIPVQEALSHHPQIGDRVHACHRTNKLKDVFERFAASRVHRLIVVDMAMRIEGVVSLTDIFSYFLQ